MKGDRWLVRQSLLSFQRTLAHPAGCQTPACPALAGGTGPPVGRCHLCNPNLCGACYLVTGTILLPHTARCQHGENRWHKHPLTCENTLPRTTEPDKTSGHEQVTVAVTWQATNPPRTRAHAHT